MKANTYILKLTTWENDGDNYNTKEFVDLSSDHVNFYIDIAELFRSRYSGGKYGNVDKVGSDYEIPDGDCVRQHDKFLIDDIKKIVDEYIEASIDFPQAWNYHTFEEGHIDDWYSDLLYDLIGSWCDGEYWRVFESFKVLYVPEPLVDVTHTFK